MGVSYTSCVIPVVALVGAVALCVHHTKYNRGHMATHPAIEKKWGVQCPGASSEVWWHSCSVHGWCTDKKGAGQWR